MGLNDTSISRKNFLFLVILLLPVFFFGESPNDYAGANSCKYLKNYSPDDYQLQPQNWFIIQDKQGVIYAANQGGLMEFDGVSWKVLAIPNLTARSIAIDDNGTIYVGGRDEIGYLSPDSKGTLIYQSLLSHLENDQKSFGPVRKTHALKEGIYYWTAKYLFHWDPVSQKMKVWEPKSLFTASFTCNGKLYLCQQNIGLIQMVNNSPILLPGGDKFADTTINMMVPCDDHRLLLGTPSIGFYLYDGAGFTPFPMGAGIDAYLAEKQLYFAARLSNGNFALATRSGGLLILDARGKLKEIMDGASGLQDNSVWHVFQDSQENIWLALNKGITKIEYASPFSIYDDKSANLPGIVLSVSRHGPQKEIYAGATDGLFILAPNGKFSLVPGIPTGLYWSLLSNDDALLAAANIGIFQLKNNTVNKISDVPSYVLVQSQKHSNRTWAGTKDGLISLWLDKTTGRWTEEYKYQNIKQDIRSIQEDPQGNLWLGTLTQGVINVVFAVPPAAPGAPGVGQTGPNPMTAQYGPDQGLPKGETHVFSAADHIVFATEKGLYRFDEKKKGFSPDPILGKEFADGSRSIFRIAEDHRKNIWFHSKLQNYRAEPQADGTYKIDDKTFRRVFRTQANAIYHDPNGQFTWFATSKGLVRYDPSIKKNSNCPFQTLIRKVATPKAPIFEGSKNKEANNAPSRLPVILYKERNLRFEFAAPFFEAEIETQYQCLLEGYDKDWTDWTKETWKEYTNLDSGRYTFRVRAQNIYATIGIEDTFKFRVFPPWYRTWWAFSIYAAAAFFMLFFIIKWRSRKLVREKQRLEQIILERTNEIKRQSEKLAEMANVKSRFFANISHEFRTPLTLIMGPLEKMLASCSQNQQTRDLKLMMRNSQRLLSLINQLLDLSKFDSGAIKLHACRQNVVPFLKGILYSFDSLAEQNDQVLTFYTAAAEIILYFDPPRLEEIMVNLLSNAVKFTPAGGKITMELGVVGVTNGVAGATGNPGANRTDFLAITIRDTGPGIPEEQLAHIFDRFYQADSTYEHHHKGSGIGLSIAKEIVELHHGSISAYSSHEKGEESGEPGEPAGAKFVVRLPMGDAHLAPGEIVAASSVSWKLPDEAPHKIAGLYLPDVGDTREHPKLIHNAEPIIAGADSDKEIILVVEDSADMRLYIRGALEPLYTVLEAHDGEQGVQKAREIIPDLIICDVMMPVMDGYDACRGLKNDIATSHIPVILLTAKAGEESILAGLETGADDYITKPFSTRILCARIKNLIDLRRQLQETFKRELTLKPTTIKVSPIDEEFLKDLYKVLGKNISDPEFNVEELSRKLYMNRVTLYRKINALTGENPSDFIRSYRLKQGAELLKTSDSSVLEVAFDVGFSSSSYFIKCFKEEFHQLPSEYQRAEKMKEG
ncbi:MAG: ATP-binding protein [Candidatus Aminicenantes bacterium]|nr:ATP-binding protein [Candidatus Aminicenantes bacterium]